MDRIVELIINKTNAFHRHRRPGPATVARAARMGKSTDQEAGTVAGSGRSSWKSFAALCLVLLPALMSIPHAAWGCGACVTGPGSDVYVYTHQEVQEDRLVRLDIQWELNEKFPHVLLRGYDTEKGGRPGKAERAALTEVFENFQSLDYFMTLTVNGRNVSRPVFENERLEWDGEHPGFFFSMPLNRPIEDLLELTLRFNAPNNLLMFYYNTESVKWNAPGGYRISDNTKVFPQVLEIRIQPETPVE